MCKTEAKVYKQTMKIHTNKRKREKTKQNKYKLKNKNSGREQSLPLQNKTTPHVSVLLQETLTLLNINPDQNFIDTTFGAGGHTQAILEKNYPDGAVLALDTDPNITAEQFKQQYNNRFIFRNENFFKLKHVIASLEKPIPFHGILFDLGVSSMQIDSDTKGISFRHDAPLDMRLNNSQATTSEKLTGEYTSLEELRDDVGEESITAYHLVNFLTLQALEKTFKTYGEESFSRPIAKAIVYRRKQQPITTTTELVDCILTIKKKRPQVKTHPATKIFQALRIAVNNELEHLSQALEQTLDILQPNGRIAVISFHSLEDRIVKQFFQKNALTCICPPRAPICTCNTKPKVEIITRKAIIPSEEEQTNNPRSRSAKLRVAKKI